ncbi:cytochrome c oxidase assembly protein subunit 11 [Caulobacter ginsengisoli]|uniref:Cytochrome c oxidase assembly protein CtaG n=2 Tax=Caulobacter ginsengisoli TaxID=400775 RepID=A0ABU0J0C7_9CAUL|nr:cytochrome c oxidase assembly protein subunit 11 [Caulobacter ginsengisoli]
MQTGPSKRRNALVAVVCLGVFAGMVGAAYAAVPLYKAFCQLTGYDGTVRQAAKAPDKALDRTIVIRFDTNVRDLPFDFKARQLTQTLKIGETGLAYFTVTNTSDKPYTARASYNVLPEQAGAYFQKLQCFCFSDQTIGPHQTMEFPVLYFVDPKYADDFETRGSGEVTLSYTFFPVDQKRAESASGPLGGKVKAGL